MKPEAGESSRVGSTLKEIFSTPTPWIIPNLLLQMMILRTQSADSINAVCYSFFDTTYLPWARCIFADSAFSPPIIAWCQIVYQHDVLTDSMNTTTVHQHRCDWSIIHSLFNRSQLCSRAPYIDWKISVPCSHSFTVYGLDKLSNDGSVQSRHCCYSQSLLSTLGWPLTGFLAHILNVHCNGW